MALTQLMAAHIVEKFTGAAAESTAYRGGLPIRQLRKVEDYVAEHKAEDISVEQLAELVELERKEVALSRPGDEQLCPGSRLDFYVFKGSGHKTELAGRKFHRVGFVENRRLAFDHAQDQWNGECVVDVSGRKQGNGFHDEEGILD